MSDNKIPRSSLQAEVVSRLRDEIVAGYWRPGLRLQERLLCERYGISRSPLREAFQVLQSEGLIDLTMNRGAIVSTPTPDLTLQYFELLKTLELMAVRLACANADEEDLEHIKDAERQMQRGSAKNDMPQFFRANNDVHRRIVLAAGNAPLAESHLIAARQIIRVQNLEGIVEHVTSEGVHEHDDIISALEQRDAAEAHSLFTSHLETVEDNLRRRLSVLGAA